LTAALNRSAGTLILTLDLDGPRPIYLQIYQQIADAVSGGQLQVAATLPSTRQLARDLGINYHTVHRAYDLLVAGGIIAMQARHRAVVLPADSRTITTAWLTEWSDRIRVLFTEAYTVGMDRADLRRQIDQLLGESPVSSS